MSKFKKGEVVLLNSGSCEMTIVGVYSKDDKEFDAGVAYGAYKAKFGESDAYYCCVWFVKEKKYESVFPEEALNKTE